MSTPAVTQDWFAQNAPKGAPAAGGDWFAQNARPPAAETPELSFLQRMATAPNNIPLDTFWHTQEHVAANIGQGVAQTAEAVAHPIKSAEALLGTAKEVGSALSGDEDAATRLVNAAKEPFSDPLALGDAAGRGAGQIIAGMGADETLAAAKPLAAKGLGYTTDLAKSGTEKAINAARNVTPKQAATAAGGVLATKAAHTAGLGAWSLPAGTWAGKTVGYIAESLLGKDRANTPIFQKATSLNDATDALAEVIAKDRGAHEQAAALGKLPATGAQPGSATGEALATKPQATDVTAQLKAKTGSAPRFTPQDRAAAQSLLEDALKQHTEDVVKAVNPKDVAQTQGAVDYYLRKGDVAQAERALDAGAKAANPEQWTPLERKPAPSTNEIRERVQAEAKMPAAGSKEDQLDTHALQQEMNWNLERHGWSAESEARREFIARNSNYFNKSGKSRGYVEGEKVKLTTTPTAKASGTSAQGADSVSGTGDLTDLLQKSLDEVRRKQQEK